MRKKSVPGNSVWKITQYIVKVKCYAKTGRKPGPDNWSN